MGRVGGILLLACSCQSLPEHDPRLVELLRRGRLDEAAAQEPEKIGDAVYAYIAELSDPDAVVRHADFFLKHYPFSLRDLPLDAHKLEAVAVKRARAKAEPATDLCRGVENIKELSAVLKWLKDFPRDHRDGDRCALRIYAVSEKFHLEASTDDISSFVIEFEDAFRTSVFPVLAALRVSEEMHEFEGARYYWLSFMAHSGNETWSRLRHAQFAWVCSHVFNTGEYGWTGEGIFAESGLSPRLRELGSALRACAEAFEEKNYPELERAVGAIDRLAENSPFADAAKYRLIIAHLLAKDPTKAEQIFRRYGKRPYASRVLLELAREEEDAQRAKQFCLEAARDYPKGEAIPWVWNHLATLYGDEGNESRMIECFEKTLSFEPTKDAEYGYSSPADARSSAQRSLAEYYRSKGLWNRALDGYKAWRPSSFCGTCNQSMSCKKAFYIGLCLEHLDRRDEAIPYYWQTVKCDEEVSLEAANYLLGLYDRAGKTDQLKKLVAETKLEEKSFAFEWLLEALKRR